MNGQRVPGHVEQSVDAIAAIERQSERSISPHQRGIELIERLRDDSPDVAQRVDPEAREMQSAADPKRVLEVMEARQQSSSSASEGQGATSERPAHSSS